MMAGETWQFAATLVAVALLVLLAHAVGFSRPAELDSEEEAAELARLAPGGFDPVEVALDDQRRGAICRNNAGEILLLVPLGAQFVPLIPGNCALWRLDSDTLVADNADGKGRTIALRLGEQSHSWAKRLAGTGGGAR